MSQTTRSRALAFAHRGGAALWPENTVFAFQESVKLGVDALELDLRLTRDGHLVVLHDALVDRTTNGSGPVAALTLAEVRALDAGHHHRGADGTTPFRGLGLSVPTLEEVVKACPGVRLNVELKPGCAGLAERALTELDRLGLADRVIVASLSNPTLKRFRALSGGQYQTAACRLEAWLFFLGFKCRWRGPTPRYHALQVPDRYLGMEIVTPAFVAWAHQKGLDVHVWTVNAPRRMREMLAAGVDGVMTDRPDLLLAALN